MNNNSTENINCPLCGFDLDSFPQTQRGYYYYECPHCGKLKITEEAIEDWDSYIPRNTDALSILSHFARRAQTSENKWTIIDTQKLESVIKTSCALPTPQEQAEYFIHFLGTSVPGPGETITVSWKEHGALIGAKSSDGFNFVINGLASEGFIFAKDNKNESANVTLTFKGWQKYEELRRGATLGRKAFMAMSYGKKEIDAIVNNCFRPAVQETGFVLKRLDDEPKAGLIDDRLRVEIKTARFLIADLTFDNSGAYWEAGYAEGLGKPVIYTCEKEHFKKGTHFDTNHHLTVIWDKNDPEQAGKLLKATIRATMPDSKTE